MVMVVNEVCVGMVGEGNGALYGIVGGKWSFFFFTLLYFELRACIM